MIINNLLTKIQQITRKNKTPAVFFHFYDGIKHV